MNLISKNAMSLLGNFEKRLVITNHDPMPSDDKYNAVALKLTNTMPSQCFIRKYSQ
jgi:hypothetical protein